MNSQTRKYTVKCLMCNEEIKEPLSSYFADAYNCQPWSSGIQNNYRNAFCKCPR